MQAYWNEGAENSNTWLRFHFLDARAVLASLHDPYRSCRLRLRLLVVARTLGRERNPCGHTGTSHSE